MSEPQVGGRWRRWAAELPPLALLTAAVTVVFWTALTTSATFFLRDILFTYRPYRAVVAKMIRDGVFPHWNPYVYFGQPLHAVLIQVTYPTTLLHYILPFEEAFKAHIIAHYYLAAFGMYALGRALHMSRAAACAASVTYALGSFMASDGSYFNSLTTAGWAPWVILALVACARRPTLARLALASLPLAFALVGGEAQTLFLSVTTAFLVAVADAEGPIVRRIVRVTIPFGIVGVLGLSLAAVQVLPTLEMISLSPRGAELSEGERTHFSLVGLTSLELLVPKILGSAAGDYYYMGARRWGGATGAQYPYFLSIYIGLAPFCLWGCGAILGRGGAPRVLGVLALLSIVLMYGAATPLYGAFVEAVPGLKSFRYPVKYYAMASLAGSLLAGYGVDALTAMSWRESSVARRRVWGTALAVVLAGIAVGGWALVVGKEAIPYLYELAKSTQDLRESTKFEHAERMFLEALRSIGVTVALHVALLLAAAWALSGRRVRVAAAFVVAILAVDFARANQDLHRTAEPEVLAMAPGVLEGLPPERNTYRITSHINPSEHKLPEELAIGLSPGAEILSYHQFFRMGVMPSTAIAYGFRYGSLFDFGSIYPRVLLDLRSMLTNRPMSEWVTCYQRTGVRYVVCLEPIDDPRVKLLRTVPYPSSMPFLLYEVEDPLPRALLVPSARRVADERKRMRDWLSPEFDPRAEVLLEGTGAVPPGRGPIAQRVEVEEGKDPSLLTVRVDAERDAWLLVTDSWWPGWKATVDGAPVEIERANLMFRAVRVPAGRHEVRFRYDPWTFRVGLAVTYATAALCVLLLLVPLALGRPLAIPTAWIEAWADRWRWPLGLGAAVTWFHLALLSPATSLFAGDHFYTYRPYRWAISEIWRQGELPLWNPGLFFGQPLLATLSLVLYPTSLLYGVLPFDTAYDFHYLVHAYVAAFGMYALGRRLGWEPWMAFVGAVTWALGGYVVSTMQFYNVVVTAAWAPSLLWAIDRAVERPSGSAISLAALVACLQLLGGEVLTIAFTHVVGLTLWARHVPSERRVAWTARASGAIAACVALGTLLAAFQVLPTLELLSRSPRAQGLPESDRLGFSMRWETTAELAWPRILGDPVGDACYQGGALWGSTKYRLPPYLLSRYVGAVMLLLALFGGIVSKGWRPRVLLFLMLFGLAQMFGRNLPEWARAMDWLPFGGSLRSPIKFFALVSLAQAVLVGEVLAFLSTRGWRELGAPRRATLLAGAVAALLVLATGLTLWGAADSYVPHARQWLVERGLVKLDFVESVLIVDRVLAGGARHAGLQSLLGAIVLASTALVIWRPSWRGWSVPVLVLSVVADLAYANRSVAVVAPVDDLALRPAALDLLPPEARSERIHVACVETLDPFPSTLRISSSDPHDIRPSYRFHEAILSPYVGFRYGVRYGVPFDPGRIYPREMDRVRAKWREEGSGPRTRFLRRSGIRYTFALEAPIGPLGETAPAYVERGQEECFANLPLKLYEVTGSLPRAYVVGAEVQEADLDRAVDLWLSKGFDPTREVIVEGTPVSGGGSGTARVVSETSREVVVEADAPRGGTLVLLDSYAPGWEAEVDGRPAQVVRANALFRGVRLQPGRHTVRFRYDPASFRVGAALSLAALAILVALSVRGRGGGGSRNQRE